MTAGEALCTLCGASSFMDDDVNTARGIVSAYAWAVHFAQVHPDVGSELNRYVALRELDGDGG